MANALLDHFGKLLMEQVRDQTIEEWDMLCDGRMKGTSAQDMRRVWGKMSKEQRELLAWAVPRIVDNAVHNLLWMLEQSESVRVHVETGDGATDNLSGISDGLCGEMPTVEGWVGRFSKQRRGWS